MRSSIRWEIVLVIVLAVAVIAVALVYLFGLQDTKVATTNTVNDNTISNTNSEETNTTTNEDLVANMNSNSSSDFNNADVTFGQQSKSAHFETSTPSHQDVVPAVPINVVINFNFDLSSTSTISILNNGIEYGTGSTSVDSTKLALRRTMKSDAPDGQYTVKYNACWPDNSCHDGQFEFVIDSTLAAGFEDHRNQASVTISLADLQIQPNEIRISKGTKVVWQNDDEVGHYINTDSHPAHTYFPLQNSQELNTGDQYSVTFDTVGYYPYHCSAHADEMTGTIVVE